MCTRRVLCACNSIVLIFFICSIKIPVPDGYRGQYKGSGIDMFIFSFSPKVSHSSDPEAGKKYANAVKEAIEEFARRGEKLAGFIHESIQGVGG